MVANDGVGTGVTRAVQIATTLQDEFFLVDAERVADAGTDRVDAGIGDAAINFPRIVDEIGVVTGVTTKIVQARATLEHIVARAADQNIAPGSAAQTILARQT